MDELTKDSLPDVGERRFWRVEHNPKSSKTPVKVSLMQRLAGTTRNNMCTLVAFDNCIATPESIIETAELIDSRASRVDEVTGDY